METLGLGAYIRELRAKKGLTQKQLGELIGTSAARIAQIEGGQTKLPGAEVRRQLAKALGVSHLRILIEAGEITEQELGTTVGLVEVAPDDPREAFIERVRRLKWTEGVNRSLTFAIGIVEAEQGTSGE